MKRRPMSNQSSQKVFKAGTKVHPKNNPSSGASHVMRGGIRL